MKRASGDCNGVSWTWLAGSRASFPHWRHGNVAVYPPYDGMTDWVVRDDKNAFLRFTGADAERDAFQYATQLVASA